MAPPAGQRSGTNRKAQLGVFAGYLFASIGAAIGALLLIISLWRPEAFAGMRSMALDVTSSLGEAGAAGRARTGSFIEAIAGYYEAGSKNAELQQEMRIARVKLAEAEALAQENARLKAVLGMVEEQADTVAVGRLIGSSSASARRIAFLSVGTREGVAVGMPVTSPMGLVGRVLETGRTSSRVLLLTDSESIIPVRRATDDVIAFAEGRADGSLRLRLVLVGVNPLEVGDVFVTSGAGGLFRPGIAVAMVTELTDEGAIGRLLSNPAATDTVIVEPVWQPEAIERPDLQVEPEPQEANEQDSPPAQVSAENSAAEQAQAGTPSAANADDTAGNGNAAETSASGASNQAGE